MFNRQYAHPWEGGRKRRFWGLFSVSFPHPVQGAALNAGRITIFPPITDLIITFVEHITLHHKNMYLYLESMIVGARSLLLALAKWLVACIAQESFTLSTQSPFIVFAASCSAETASLRV
jgi:hypothetical protein